MGTIQPKVGEPLTEELQRDASDNVKRTHPYRRKDRDDWFLPSAQSLDEIAMYSEIKTIWHPAGI